MIDYSKSNNDSSITNFITVFGANNKACSFGLYSRDSYNYKFRFAISEKLMNNGNPQWDFNHSNTTTIDYEDLTRVVIGFKQLIRAYLQYKNGKPLEFQKIQIPLVRKSSGNIYGTFNLDLIDDKNGDYTFALGFKCSGYKDANEIVEDQYIFRKSFNNEGCIKYCDSIGNIVKVVDTSHLQFTQFMELLDSILHNYRIISSCCNNIRMKNKMNNNSKPQYTHDDTFNGDNVRKYTNNNESEDECIF